MNQKRILNLIKRKEVEIQDLENQAREGRAYVQALYDVLKMMPRDTQSAATPDILRAGSAAAKARDLILAAGAPVHVSDLLKQMGKEISRESRSSLSGTLAAYVRKGEIFTRPGPNLFGLVEMNGQPEPKAAAEMPADFGAVDDDDDIPF